MAIEDRFLPLGNTPKVVLLLSYTTSGAKNAVIAATTGKRISCDVRITGDGSGVVTPYSGATVSGGTQVGSQLPEDYENRRKPCFQTNRGEALSLNIGGSLGSFLDVEIEYELI
jgi:hypothetical protein